MFATLGAGDADQGAVIQPCYNICRNVEAPVKVMIDMCGPETLELSQKFAEARGKGLRVAGTVRNPVNMVVSAYCYHARGEEIFNAIFFPPGWPLVTVASLPFADGLSFVAKAAAPMVQNMTDMFDAPHPDRFRLDYENATASSEGFDKAAEEMVDFLFGDMISEDDRQQCLEASKWADLNRYPDGVDDHKNDPECEARALQAFTSVLPADLLAQYRSFQERLGYQTV